MHHTYLPSVHLRRGFLSELRLFAGLSFLRRCLRRWLPGNWRGYKFRSVAPDLESRCECSILTGALPRTSHWPACRWFCGNGKRMEMDTVASLDDWSCCTNLWSISAGDVQEDHPAEASEQTWHPASAKPTATRTSTDQVSFVCNSPAANSHDRHRTDRGVLFNVHRLQLRRPLRLF
jgi:hypothetical protein